MIKSDEGVLEMDVAGEDGAPIRIVLYDTETDTGVAVVGMSFLDQAEVDALAEGDSGIGIFALSPQSVSAHVAPFNHTHTLGPPFHSCSYLYMYANSRDAFIHICPTDVGNIRFVGSAAAALIGVIVATPLIGWLAGVIVWLGVGYFQNPDGSIDLFAPAWDGLSFGTWLPTAGRSPFG